MMKKVLFGIVLIGCSLYLFGGAFALGRAQQQVRNQINIVWFTAGVVAIDKEVDLGIRQDVITAFSLQRIDLLPQSGDLVTELDKLNKIKQDYNLFRKVFFPVTLFFGMPDADGVIKNYSRGG